MRLTLKVLLILFLMLSSCTKSESTAIYDDNKDDELIITNENKCSPVIIDFEYNTENPMRYFNDVMDVINTLPSNKFYYGTSVNAVVRSEFFNPYNVFNDSFTDEDCEKFGFVTGYLLKYPYSPESDFNTKRFIELQIIQFSFMK